MDPAASLVVPEGRRTSAPARALGMDLDALEGFCRQVPGLFRSHQAPVDAEYQRLLYTVAHDFTPGHLDAIDAAFGLGTPEWSPQSRADTIALLDAMRYPDTAPLQRLRGVGGLSLSHVSHYLHFFHHVYPIYSEPACRALGRLGVEVPWVRQRDGAVYGLYTQAVEAVKEYAPYGSFPEYNVSLQRIVQGALHAWGAEARPAPRHAPART